MLLIGRVFIWLAKSCNDRLPWSARLGMFLRTQIFPFFKNNLSADLKQIVGQAVPWSTFSQPYLVTLSNSCLCRHKSGQHRVNFWISGEQIGQFVNRFRRNFKNFYANIYGRPQSFISLGLHKFPRIWIFWRSFPSLIYL